MRWSSIFVLFAFFCLSCLFSCKKEDKTDELVGRTAKLYYEQLLEGDYDAFVDAYYYPDRIPPTYRSQLKDNMKMFMKEQEDRHRGIKKVEFERAHVDSMRHFADVFLLLTYGDSVKEQICVPMINHKNTWYLR